MKTCLLLPPFHLILLLQFSVILLAKIQYFLVLKHLASQLHAPAAVVFCVAAPDT